MKIAGELEKILGADKASPLPDDFESMFDYNSWAEELENQLQPSPATHFNDMPKYDFEIIPDAAKKAVKLVFSQYDKSRG